MNKPVIVIKVSPRKFAALSALIQYVITSLTGNLHFTTPTPTLIVMQAALDDLNDAITKWGTVGNRGKHQDHVDLVSKAQLAYALLRQLADYCMTVPDPASTFEEQAAILVTTGFDLKDEPNPIGVLEPVQNFRHEVSPELNANEAKFTWDIPSNAHNAADVRIYKIYKGIMPPVFSTSAIYATSTITSFIDSNNSGATQTYAYWIRGVNAAGDGAVSEVIVITIPSA